MSALAWMFAFAFVAWLIVVALDLLMPVVRALTSDS
jgi:hypothetical protein